MTVTSPAACRRLFLLWPIKAKTEDVQHRILSGCIGALERTGHAFNRHNRRIGVFTGVL